MSEKTPKMIGVRPDDDVRLLLEKAADLPGREFRNWSRMANAALRSFLTPLVGNKRIRNLQEKMGVKVE